MANPSPIPASTASTQAKPGYLSQVAEGIKESVTTENAAAATGWYLGRFVKTWGPQILIQGTVFGAKALAGSAVTGTFFGLAGAPIIVPVATVLATTAVVEGTKYGIIKAVDLTKEYFKGPNGAAANPAPAPQTAAQVAAQNAVPEKKEQQSIAHQCGEAIANTYAPYFVAKIAAFATERLAESFGLPSQVGTIVGNLVTAPLVTPSVMPIVADAVGTGIEKAVEAASKPEVKKS